MKINSVLLIRPHAIGKKEFPFGLLYVGTALKNRGYQVKIIDLHDGPDKEKAVEEILSKNPNILLGINAHAGSCFWVKEFTLALKEKLPDLKIVLGGHIAIMYNLLLKKTGVDFVCLSEGEITLPLLIEKLNQASGLKDVPGIAFREGEEILRTNIKLLAKDKFIMPDFSLIEVERYLIHPTKDWFFSKSQRYLSRSKPDDKLAAIMFSRGCLGACDFCYRHLPGFRQPPVEWCWHYLKILGDKYGVKYFRIDDELFATDLAWLREFHRKVMDSKIDILFRVTGLRVDLVNDELLEMLKEMGCIAINYGIESGSQRILDRMNKRTTVSQNINALKKTLEHGLQVMAYIMLGYEGETKETLKETLAMLLETGIDPEYVSLFFTIPLPGTRLYQNCLQKGLIRDEEKFMQSLYGKISDQYERYFIQLGEVSRDELDGFKKKLLFLLTLKKFISKDSLIFKIIRTMVFLIPYKSRLNIIFSLGRRFLVKIFKSSS